MESKPPANFRRSRPSPGPARSAAASSRRQLPAGGELLCLGWVEGGVLLHPEAALRDYGVPNGGRLILT